MRTGLLLTLMLGSSLAFADHPSSLERPVVSTSPFAAIARVVTSREAGKTVSARFDAATCAVHIRFYISGGVTELDIPLRKVSWSMTTEKRGAESQIVATARCPAKDRRCITGTRAELSDDGDPASPEKIGETRFAFRIAAPAVEARKRFGELKTLDMHCMPLAKP